MVTEKIREFEKRIGYTFHNTQLLVQAFTHSSYSNERKINKIYNYERLEFLGDAVLELVVSHFFFEKIPKMSEGEMTKLRSSMVCEAALAMCARDLSVEAYILLGKGEENTGGRKRNSIVSDVMEAIIGALYLDGGLETAKAFIHEYVLTDIDSKKLFYDSKTILQEEVQKNEETPLLQYQLVAESGPEHDKEFRVCVLLNGDVIGEGSGKTKKSAEQSAAYQALMKGKYVFKKY